MQFSFVCTSVVSYMAFDMFLFVPHFYIFQCLGRVVLRDCGISWVSSFIFFLLAFVFTISFCKGFYSKMKEIAPKVYSKWKEFALF